LVPLPALFSFSRSPAPILFAHTSSIILHLNICRTAPDSHIFEKVPYAVPYPRESGTLLKCQVKISVLSPLINYAVSTQLGLSSFEISCSTPYRVPAIHLLQPNLPSCCKILFPTA
jgi:hypothetical protein